MLCFKNTIRMSPECGSKFLVLAFSLAQTPGTNSFLFILSIRPEVFAVLCYRYGPPSTKTSP